MSPDRFTLTVQALLGQPWPMPPKLPGVVYQCRDEPLTAEELADITSATELALCAGISRQAAQQRLQRPRQADPSPPGGG